MEKGIEKGMQVGMRAGRNEVISNMLKEKLDVALISQVTGLSEKEIKKLKNSSQ